MEYIAESKNVKVSPRKARLVAEGVKKMPIGTALLQLQMLHKRAAAPVRKTLASALANAIHNFHAVQEDLVIQDVLVNEGMRYKRYHFASRGRIKPYKKRTSHIRVVLVDKSANVKKIASQVAAPVQLAAKTAKKGGADPRGSKRGKTQKSA